MRVIETFLSQLFLENMVLECFLTLHSHEERLRVECRRLRRVKSIQKSS